MVSIDEVVWRLLCGTSDMLDGSFAPVILRLAWHASGTYDKNDGTGGSNYATMRFANESGHGGNAGLVSSISRLLWQC